jgi:acyl phosphate:glycerol-3-phosphate acyltransferase
MLWIAVITTAVISYLIGSFPSGYLAGRAHGLDLRKEGSGNVGATNALRVLGKKIGYTVFAADIFKGWLAVMTSYVIVLLYTQMTNASQDLSVSSILNFLVGSTPAPPLTIRFGILGAICGMLGHIFPIWLGFKGGKGIATAGGIMIALFPIQVFLAGISVWLILFFATRYVSIASIGAAITLPTASGILLLMGKCDALRLWIAGVMCVLAIWRHKSNIQRLLAGTEKKFEKKLPPQTPSDNSHV